MKINVKEILTLPAYILTALSIASGFILFLPEPFIKQMFMSDFRDDFGFVIGITFIISTSILLVSFFLWFLKLIRNKWVKRKFYKTRENRLDSLNDYQKTIIYGLYLQDNRTSSLPLNDGAVSELEYNSMKIY